MGNFSIFMTLYIQNVYKIQKIDGVMHTMMIIMFKIVIKNVIYILDLCPIITYNMVDVLFLQATMLAWV